MPSRRSQLLGSTREVVLEIALAILTTGSFIGWAVSRLESDNGPWIFLGAVAMLTSTLAAIALFRLLVVETKPPKGDSLRRALSMWALDRNFSLKNTTGISNAAWSVEVTDPYKRPFTISELKDRPVLSVVGLVDVSKEHRRLFEANPAQAVELLNQLRLELARFGGNYQVNHTEGVLNQVTLEETLSLDAVDDESWYRTVGRVRSAMLMTVVLVDTAGRKIRAASGGTEEPPPSGAPS